MLPEHRLAVLLTQVKRSQISNCLYHNMIASPSLYQDHHCDRHNFPVKSFLELDKHVGEIWQVVFSHDGSRLASGGSDGLLIIYEVGSFEVLHTLAGHESGVCSISWSPDDSLLVTGSTDKRARLWNAAVSSFSTSMVAKLNDCRLVNSNGLCHGLESRSVAVYGLQMAKHS